MPWTELADGWNVMRPVEEDVEGMVYGSLHGHLWNGDVFTGFPGERHRLWVGVREEMEAFYGAGVEVGGVGGPEGYLRQKRLGGGRGSR